MTPAPSAYQSQSTLKRLTLLMVLASLFTGPVLAQVIGDLNVEGDIKAGTTTMSATVKVFKSGSASEVVETGSDADGGRVLIYDNTNAMSMYIAAALGTTGGYLDLLGSTAGAFFVDGDGGASGNPRVLITGTSTTVFDTNVTGDASVALPVDAVNATEIQNETGVAQSVSTGFIELAGDIILIHSATIIVPDSGYVLVIGSGSMRADTTRDTHEVQVGVTEDCDGSPTFDQQQRQGWVTAVTLANTPLEVPFSGQKIFPVKMAGPETYCIVAQLIEGDVEVRRATISLVYIPTSYGSVDQTRPGGEGDNGAVTASEIAAEPARSAAANQARIDREFSAMRARMEALEAELREIRQRKGYGDPSGGGQ